MKNLIIVLLLLPLATFASDESYTLMLKNHAFQPSELIVPAGKKITLRIENQDATPEEFESYALNREKIISGNGKITLFIGPLDAGRYPFFGEFNEATARGTLIAQ